MEDRRRGIGRVTAKTMTSRKGKGHPTKADPRKNETRQALAKMVIRLFRLWKLGTADQLNLLGLRETSRAMLSRFARGGALPSARDILDRVGWLLSIHKALRLLYPKNDEMRRSWVHRRNVAFDGLTPLAVMKEHGLVGIALISRYLDSYIDRVMPVDAAILAICYPGAAREDFISEVKAAITASGVPIYQSDPAHPSKVQQLMPDGTRRTGVMRRGRFVADPPSEDE